MIRTCRYGMQNCQNKWTTVGTIMGKCIRLDVNEFANVTSRDKLLIQFIVNKSDTTVTSRDGHGYNFLSNSAINGITLYFRNVISLVIFFYEFEKKCTNKCKKWRFGARNSGTQAGRHLFRALPLRDTLFGAVPPRDTLFGPHPNGETILGPPRRETLFSGSSRLKTIFSGHSRTETPFSGHSQTETPF